MAPGFRDLFSRDSAAYAKFRPRYPAQLFEWLATLPAGRRLAWDCATGNGQAATMLARHFERVVGTDASVEQLRAADAHPNLSYVVCLAEASSLRSGIVDLVTVAQAFHWLDHAAFFAEVNRVAAPGAAVAIWGYARLIASPEINRLIGRFHDDTVGPYWTPERRQVEEGYRAAVIPIAEVEPPPLAIEASFTLPELLGYLGTWSAVARYRVARGHDPVELVEPELRQAWGGEARRRIVWPLFVRAGRWLGSGRTG